MGTYTITLYYSQAEVNGWQTATSQSVNNIQLIKATNVISSVTPGNPGPGGTILVATPLVSTLGTNTALTYSFATGFSGFGAGITGTPLPIQLLSFGGWLQNSHSYLAWTTSGIGNSSGFSIERSYNGIDFSKIGYVATTGGIDTAANYSFLDPEVAEADNYYRLSEVQSGGQLQYSSVVHITNTDYDNGFKVINNPFTTVLNLQWGQHSIGSAEIQIHDITGKEVFHQHYFVNSNQFQAIDLSTSRIRPGIYFLRASVGMDVHVAKLIKQF